MAYKILLCTFLFAIIYTPSILAKKELKLLHVLSANKFYVPDYNYSSTAFEIPTNLSYHYYLQNAVDVPNSVKMHLFNLGVNLRNMYSNFLGPVYRDEISHMQTVEFPVSIIAGELINAGLWPPVDTQIWKDDLIWQPIPFDYEPAKTDTLLLGTLCPSFEAELQNVLKNHYNATDEHVKLLNYMNEKGQVNAQNPIDVSLFYLALENSVELKQTHPEWVKKIFPSKDLLNLTMTAYNLLSETKLQKRLNGGSFIKMVIKNSMDYINETLSNERKINVYSSDERVFAGVLRNLNISLYELPTPGAALIFELLSESNNYFIKLNYYTGSSNDTIPYKLDECDLLCPIDQFIQLTADILPMNESTLCGLNIQSPVNNQNSGTRKASSVVFNTLLCILHLILAYASTKIL